MLRRCPLGALLAAVVIALAGWVVAPRSGEPALIPAPPPATCRSAPPTPAGWADYAADPAARDLTPFQDYREALGLGPGTRGDGVTIADVEYEWRPGHVELAARGLLEAPPNSLRESFRAADHGTAVLGLLGGTPDGRGVTGLVAGAELRPVSPFATGTYSPATAIASAAAGLGPGDVLLIELQSQPDEASPYLPIEAIDSARDPVRTAIQDAVRRGIVVVEPAGNGNVNLDTASRYPWLQGPDAAGHSGAIIVGAGGSPTDDRGPSDLEWTSGSNYGSRVDVQGVGVAVVTSGYGSGEGERLGGRGDTAYTACFDGTSSASATVAAAVAALQSQVIAEGRAPLTPTEVRAILRSTGAPQKGRPDRPIGPRPQVAAAIASLADVPPPGATPSPPTGPLGTGAAAPRAVPVIARVPDRPPRRAAARSVTARYAKAGGRLTIRFRGLAKGAKVTARGRRAKVVRNRIVLKRVRPGRFVVLIRPPARLRARYTVLRVVVVVPKRGTARVVRIRG